ncbi:UDP-glucose--hexose-1-phosphate uridylyltransferase [Granulicatella sp. zg-ZJ]|nr:UDP-glucose--hexose-1-phosphate uridylyltransferase [Granulicatella sp. zg-ZJ]NEW62340.1 UDP-glucose--hexose-1-phosphate uridylyltransferase [Granulicatella sp. zg-ZJ]
MDVYINKFIKKAVQDNYIDRLDEVVQTNRLLHVLQKDAYEPMHDVLLDMSYQELLDKFVEDAIKRGVIDTSLAQKEQLEAEIMSVITPLPSVVNHVFWDKYMQSKELATRYFFQLSQDNDYIKTRAIQKNISFSHDSRYGTLEITINLSKPEKDPKDIAKARQMTQVSYPESQLTMTNEGYYGRINHPARSNHRIIRLCLGEDKWGFQYSPYAYFNEHSIFLSQEVRPMNVNKTCLANLLHIVEIFPHYFVGSNAGLPIVGGSILSHDHYQAGRHEFPMDNAREIPIEEIKGVKASLLYWPLSVIRLKDVSIDKLIDAGGHILSVWKAYSDETVDIKASTNGVPHNTVTPIARYKNNMYELDIVLRNNRTSSEYPDGIFHPHPDVQHIKKENIGLIEVMGLAILPPRLKEELKVVQDYLDGKDVCVNPIHTEWAMLLKDKGISVEQGVGQVFERVLEDAGVFKQTVVGQEAFYRFIEEIRRS